MAKETEEEHILELSRELLDDIELDRLPADKLLLKASRLARLAGSEEIRKWLGFEMQGYNSKDPVSLSYMSKTGRWTKYEEKKGYYGSLGQHQATIEANKARIEATKLGNLSGDSAVGAINVTTRNHGGLSSSITKLSGVRFRVLGLLHAFISGVYYERQFADLAESTFQGYKNDVDAIIGEKCGEVLVKIPSVIARLNEGKEEAISQALNTCRRIIESFADAIYPPTSDTYEIGGNKLKLDASKYQNRINVFIAERSNSTSRRQKLRQNLANLYDRVSTGVHADVTPEEAYSLFLNVYLFLGEVLQLDNEVDASRS